MNEYSRSCWKFNLLQGNAPRLPTVTTALNCLWENAMKKLAVVVAMGATALLGTSAAKAADHSGGVKATESLAQITDFSSRHRDYRIRRFYRQSYRPNRSYGYYPQPYYRNYGYAPQPYYGGGGPVVSFSFGRGGGGWGHRW
jgi:hypothetical protein